MTRRALVTGAGGQLGRALLAHAPDTIEPVGLTRKDLDISDADAVNAVVKRHEPDVIINCAAYTDVNGAETNRETAFAVNATGTGNVARAANEVSARLLHISTDFVFDGRSGTPYRPGDATNPLCVYGESKLAGEHAMRDVAGNAFVFRAGWLYDRLGSNFMNTVLRLCREKDSIGIVADQVGTPTSARKFAATLWHFATADAEPGVYHWSDTGVASWYDFAVAIQDEALALGLLDEAIAIKPLRTDEFPTPAARPAYSVLDKSATWDVLGHRGTHWHEALRHSLLQTASKEMTDE